MRLNEIRVFLAVYLCKRTMQNKAHLELEDFEAENLAKLQKQFNRKWEFIFMQAEAQYKYDEMIDFIDMFDFIVVCFLLTHLHISAKTK